MLGWVFDVVFNWLSSLSTTSMPISQSAQPTAEVTFAYATYVASSAMTLPKKTDESGIGSMYGTPGDKWMGGRMACAPHDPVPQNEHVCAHRYYPCGTLLIIEYTKTGHRTWCEVKDRGPYGANVFVSGSNEKVVIDGKEAWYIKKTKHDTPPADLCPSGDCVSRWRGVIDMAPGTAKAMGHPGWGSVRVWTLKRIVDEQKYLATKKSRPGS